MLVGVQGLTGGVAVSLQCRHRTEPSALLFGKVSEQEVVMFGALFCISVLQFFLSTLSLALPDLLTLRVLPSRLSAESRCSLQMLSSFSLLFFFFFFSIHQIESGRHGEPQAPASPGF